MPVLPFGEYRPDVSDYSGQHTKLLLNVLPRGDGYGPFPAFVVFSQPLVGICRGCFYARNQDGSIVIFAATATKIYRLNNSTYAWVDVSKGAPGGSYSAIPTADNWTFRQFNQKVIACQINTVPQVYDLETPALFVDLGGAPPAARYVDVVNRFLVLSGLGPSAPQAIHWSGYNNINEWDIGQSQCDRQDFPTGGPVRGCATGETGYVFSDSTVRRMTYNPGSPAIFNFDIIEEDTGLYAAASLIRARDRVFWLGPDGFKMMTPGGLPQNIGREKVDRTFFADMDASNLHCIIGVADPNASRVGWTYKSMAGGTLDCFDRMLVYDWTLDRWAPVNITGQYVVSLARPGSVTLDGLDPTFPSIDAMVTPLDDFVESVLPVVSMFDNDNQLGFFSGLPLEATLETAERGADGKRLYVRGFRPVTDAPTLFGRVSKKKIASSPVVYSPEMPINANGVVPVHADSRYVRGVVRIPADTPWTFATGIEPDSRATGGQ